MPLLDLQRCRIPLGLRARSLPRYYAVLIRNTGLWFGAFFFLISGSSAWQLFA